MEKFKDERLTFMLNFRRNEINIAYINNILNFRINNQKIIYISAILVLLTGFINLTLDNLMIILPYYLSLIIICIILLIFSKKYLWLYYIFSLIILIFCGYIYIECNLLKKIIFYKLI